MTDTYTSKMLIKSVHYSELRPVTWIAPFSNNEKITLIRDEPRLLTYEMKDAEKIEPVQPC